MFGVEGVEGVHAPTTGPDRKGELLAYRRGRLSPAMTDEHRAMAILEVEHTAVIRAYAAAFLAHALIDTGDLDLAARRLGELPLDDSPRLTPYAVAVAARGRLRLLQGDPKGALSDQRRVESLARMELPRRPSGHGAASPHWPSWHWIGSRRRRSSPPKKVELAERSGSAWAEGLALHAAGVIGGAHGAVLLQRAATRLEGVGAAAEHVRVLIDLGLMADAAGASREHAIQWLRRRLDLADRCDANLMARHAQAALVASGARPRRTRLSGADALSLMERRVAVPAGGWAGAERIVRPGPVIVTVTGTGR